MVEINIEDFKKAEAILKDLIFEAKFDKNKVSHIKTIKLLKARKENINFEIELAERICGDNTNYPYRSSFYLTKFFQDLGFQYVHSGETRRFWVQNVLKQLCIEEVAYVIEKGLFLKRNYKDLQSRAEDKKDYSVEQFLQCAIKDFRKFIDESIAANETVSLIDILDLNLNIELLFEHRANTKDEELNILIEDAKSRFLNPKDKHIAVEKLWDAFERIKTYFNSGKQKLKSTEDLVFLISKGFNNDFLDEEFRKLTYIGNNYRIRHHETNKKEIKDPKHLTYLFFRMLCLIDLCLVALENNSV